MLVPLGRIGIGLVLAGAGAGKLASRVAFRRVLLEFGVANVTAAAIVLWVLCTLEVSVGVGLTLGLCLPWTPLLACAIFAIFALAIGVRLSLGPLDAACGCFGRAFDAKIGWPLVGRNLLFAAVSLALAAASR